MIWVNYWVREAKPPHRLWHSSQKLHWYLLTQLTPRRLGRLHAWARYNGRYRGFDTSEALSKIPTREDLNKFNENISFISQVEHGPMTNREYKDYLRRIGVDPHQVEGVLNMHLLHPAIRKVHERRAADIQLRVADWVTRFAGSMLFVYLHVVVFAVWMLFVEVTPWPTLTLVVSLEAIFLSTFVMIGQNRAAEVQQAKASHDFVEQEAELKTNTEITRQIHVLATELHRRSKPRR